VEDAGPTKVSSPTSDRRTADRLALSLMLLLVVSAFLTAGLPVITPELQDRFAFSSSQIGLLMSVFMLTFCVAGIPMGLGAARWGGWTLAASTACLVAGSVLFAFSSSFAWFLGARLLQGIGAAAAVPVCTPVMAEAISLHGRNRALGIFGSGLGLGTVIALLILPSIQGFGGYRAVFLTTAGLALVVGAVVLSQRAVRSVPSQGRADASLRTLVRALGAVAVNPRVLLVAVMNASGAAASIGLITWTPGFLLNQRGAGLGVAAYVTAGIGVSQLIGNPAGAAAMARWGRGAVLLASLGALTVFVALVPLPSSVVLVFACVVIAGFFTMMGFSPVLRSIPEIVKRPEETGPATGFISLTAVVGVVFAPWLFGVLLDSYGTMPGRSGYLAGYLVLAVFPLLGAVAGAVFVLTGEKRGAAGTVRDG
jgi:MFS family permease